jgi:hypothetical protein
MTTSRGPASNWSQVRDRIDRGETGDKVAVADPAVAPLGTDAEAAGTPLAGAAVARSAAAEQAAPAAQDHSSRRTGWLVLVLAALLVAGVAILALALVR